MAKRDAKKTIKALFADAQAALAQPEVFDPPPTQFRDGVAPGKWPGAPFDAMPPDCPITVHGYQGEIIYVTDAMGQLVEVTRWDSPSLSRLFGNRQNYIEWAWPRFGKPISRMNKDTGEPDIFHPINGVEWQKCGRSLQSEAARRGMFDPRKQHRGRGGWRDADGNFIWHSGDALWTSAQGSRLQAARPGEVRGMLYTVAPGILQPWRESVSAEESPAHRILDCLRSWAWQRPVLDPLLVLGWMVTALMGGALDVRPIIFTTGGPGVGKSTLHHLVQGLLSSAVMHTADTTSAGITQEKARDSTAVIVDEFEASRDNRQKRAAVIELARVAYSGDDIYRGGADHKGHSFKAEYSFMFSAILPPGALSVQDRSRMAIINLDPLSASEIGDPPSFSEDDGRQLLRMVCDNFRDYRERMLPSWRELLRAQGFSERAGQTYGTLLAAAELALGAEALERHGLPITDERELGQIVSFATTDERQAQRPPWQECLEHLLSAPVQAYAGGVRPTIGMLIEKAQTMAEGNVDYEESEKGVALAGLKLIDPLRVRQLRAAPGDRIRLPQMQGFGLAIPPDGQTLEALFEDTKWAHGVWIAALKQAPPQIVYRTGSGEKGDFVFKVNRAAKRCVVVDLAAFDAWSERENGE